jgi:hypothetical protein
MDYGLDIVIDEQALDVEWLNQPQRMGEYCRLTADARRDMDLAAENLAFVKATVERAIRENPDRYGVKPGSRGITEGSIDAAVLIHAEYQLASRQLIDARHAHEVAVSAVRAFDQRKSALENLVRLHGQNYFAGPSVPRDLPAARARLAHEAQRQANARVRMRRRVP